MNLAVENQEEYDLKRTLTSATANAITTAAQEGTKNIVNGVLGMEERNGEVYYKVNFTGHPADYTAWACEEDLIPE